MARDRKSPRLLEKLEDQLRVGVRNAERLNAQLLLNLQRSKLSRSLVHIGIDESAHASRKRIAQVRNIVLLRGNAVCRRTEQGASLGDRAERGFNIGQQIIDGNASTRRGNCRTRADSKGEDRLARHIAGGLRQNANGARRIIDTARYLEQLCLARIDAEVADT